MLHLAILFRSLQFVAHHGHNLCNGQSFFSDHEFFGELYGKSEGYYDSIIERLIGLGYENSLSLNEILSEAIKKIEPFPADKLNTQIYYIKCAKLIKEACDMIDEFCKSGKLTEGTKQLIGGMADELEVVSYKIQRRIK